MGFTWQNQISCGLLVNIPPDLAHAPSLYSLAMVCGAFILCDCISFDVALLFSRRRSRSLSKVASGEWVTCTYEYLHSHVCSYA